MTGLAPTPAGGLPALAPIRVLVAEDEAHLGTLLQQFLAARGLDVAMVRDGQQALDRLVGEGFDVALLDIVMPGLDGLEVLRRVRELPNPPEVIIITGNGSVETAITAMRLGAYDYLSKPYRMAEIEALVRRAWEKRRLAREHALLTARRDGASPALPVPSLETRYAPLAAALRLVEEVAAGDAPVLITGAPGTGKGRLARRLHAHAERAAAAERGLPVLALPYASGDCGRAGDAALAVEVFGAERGAVTGPGSPPLAARVPGLLELVAGGTLHLAHIDRAARGVQRRLGEALEARRFHRSGQPGGPGLPLEARLVASTTRDLAALAAAEEFDRGLLDALGAVRIQLPTLAERIVDLPALARALLEELAGAQAPALTDAALDRLGGYGWPGNVRELRNVLERALLLRRGRMIDADDLVLGRNATGEAGVPPDGVILDEGGRPLRLEDLERRQIVAVLQATDWHQGRAAEQLGVSAKTLYRKIREYGLARPDGIPPRGRRPAHLGGRERAS